MRQLVLVMLACLSAAPASAAEDVRPAQVVVVFGDSQAQGLAAGLSRAARHIQGWKVQNRTKPGTAISQANIYDWPAAIAAYKPDPGVTTAVLMFGGNDRLPIRPATGAGIPFRTAAWYDAYRGRVAAILHSLATDKLRVIWVADPICRDPTYSSDMAYLNAVFRDVIAGTGATFVNTGTMVPASADTYAAYGPGVDGTTQRLRLDDGIHFTPGGYDLLAAKVMQAVAATGPAAPAKDTKP